MLTPASVGETRLHNLPISYRAVDNIVRRAYA